MGKGFEDLQVWQKAKDLAVLIYKITSDGKLSKDFGLRDQMRRSAISIPSNIAEGDERDTDKESVRFFYIAKGSLAELRTQLRIALEVGFLDKDEFAKIELDCSEIGKMLGGLIKHRKGEIRL
ncbi:MAG: four helix bundle protein [Candidatus Omnitrophota bacterium]